MKKEQLQIFKKAFFEANSGRCSLPGKINFTGENKIEFYTEGMRGGVTVHFRFKLNDKQEYLLEIDGSDDYMSWKKIIDSKGNIETISIIV